MFSIGDTVSDKRGRNRSHSRCDVARKWLIFWCLFIGIGAVAGATGMLVAPDGSAMGMEAMLPYFQVLPLAKYLYQDFIFPGIALLCVNGLPNLLVAYLLIRRKYIGMILGGVFGVTLMLWICIQFVIFPLNFMSTIYFIFGIAQAATGYATIVFYKQEQFARLQAESLAKGEEYPDIGTNPKELVVYFSRMGYTRKAAYICANESGAMIYEVKAAELTEGTKGFWWCGRYGMHRWAMPIQEIAISLEQFEKVTICSPIWVFHLAAPMREFCKRAAGKIRRADYILVHHQKCIYRNALREMDERLGIHYEKALSICCRTGRQIQKKEIDKKGAMVNAYDQG